MPLLLVDLLGMKARFADPDRGGVKGARSAYRKFEKLVSQGLMALPEDHPVGGGIASDAVAL